jgi:hypothetical protein
MKIALDHQQRYEQLLIAEAQKRGISSLAEWIEKFEAAVQEGQIPAPKKVSSETYPFWWLCQGEALSYLCATVYKYADDKNLDTVHRALYRRHSMQKK